MRIDKSLKMKKLDFPGILSGLFVCLYLQVELERENLRVRKERDCVFDAILESGDFSPLSTLRIPLKGDEMDLCVMIE